MTVFPVRGLAAFSSEFTPPRHNGVDIFAERGTPVVAPEDGEVRFGHDPLGGTVFNLRTPGGLRYYGAHLDATQGQDRSVRAGDVLGYVGTSGNAKGTSPHLHFEVHGADGAPFDPYPLLNESAGPDVKRGVLPATPVAQAPATPGNVPSSSAATPANAKQADSSALAWLLLGWALLNRKGKLL
jgi:Peptidase family M23